MNSIENYSSRTPKHPTIPQLPICKMADTTDHLTLEEKFTLLKEAKQNVPKFHKIQKVAHFLRDREQFTCHYSPKLISFGPIHHGEKKLKQGEKYKLMWANNYLERAPPVADTLYKMIADNIEELKDLFTEDVIEDFPGNEEDLSWMLFVDGCSLLEMMDKYPDPKELHIKDDQLVLVLRDLFLLENQLPFKVLELLSVNGEEGKLMGSMNKFLHHYPLSQGLGLPKNQVTKDEKADHCQPLVHILHHLCGTLLDDKKEDITNQVTIDAQPPVHFLHHLRGTLLDDKKGGQTNSNSEQKEDITNQVTIDVQAYHAQPPATTIDDQTNSKQKETEEQDITHRNIQELKTAGIKVTASGSRSLTSIDFKPRYFFSGNLKLPKITVDDTTAAIFLNLIAYEMCPDFENDYGISNFVAFMDSLIDYPSDVKELRSAKVLHNDLGSDVEVSDLFNIISKDLVTDMKTYSKVRKSIETHYTRRWNRWITQAYNTHFSTPWAITGFLAALTILVLTFIQTL